MKKAIKTIVLTSALLVSVPFTTSCSLFNKISQGLLGDVYWLTEKDKTIVTGESFTILLQTKGANDTIITFDNVTYMKKDLRIYSTNESVATVSSTGVVKGISEGNCQIVFDLGLLTYKCEVHVIEKQLATIKVNRFKAKHLINTEYTFQGVVSAVYTTGFEEVVTPNVDTSNVNITALGSYPIYISYTLKGVTKTATKYLTITDQPEELVNKVNMEYGIDEDEQARRSTALNCEGTNKILVIPVKFTDSDTYISNYNNVKADISTVFFGSESDIGWKSVKEYYETESNGKISFTGTVSDWFSCGKSSSTYYLDGGSESISQLTNRAVNWYFENHPEENRTDYDNDHNGHLDGIYIVFGSPDYRHLDEGKTKASSMWAMVRSSATPFDVTTPKVAKYFWTSYDFIYPNSTIAANRTGKSDASNMSEKGMKLSSHTFIHETGHMYGINDYYSYTTSDEFSSEAHMQSHNMMGHDPYSLLLFNWAGAIIPDSTMTIDINDIQQSGHDMILLSPSWNVNNSPFDEYLLLELYAPTGLNEFDANVSDSYRQVGIRLWHVDARLADTNGNFTFIPSTGYFQVTDNSPNSAMTGYTEYDKYAELFLIRNNEEQTFENTGYIKSSDYFFAGDTFTFEKYSKQFRETTLDNGLELGWSFSVDAIYPTETGYGATITVNKS